MKKTSICTVLLLVLLTSAAWSEGSTETRETILYHQYSNGNITDAGIPDWYGIGYAGPKHRVLREFNGRSLMEINRRIVGMDTDLDDAIRPCTAVERRKAVTEELFAIIGSESFWYRQERSTDYLLMEVNGYDYVDRAREEAAARMTFDSGRKVDSFWKVAREQDFDISTDDSGNKVEAAGELRMVTTYTELVTCEIDEILSIVSEIYGSARLQLMNEGYDSVIEYVEAEERMMRRYFEERSTYSRSRDGVFDEVNGSWKNADGSISWDVDTDTSAYIYIDSSDPRLLNTKPGGSSRTYADIGLQSALRIEYPVWSIATMKVENLETVLFSFDSISSGTGPRDWTGELYSGIYQDENGDIYAATTYVLSDVDGGILLSISDVNGDMQFLCAD